MATVRRYGWSLVLALLTVVPSLQCETPDRTKSGSATDKQEGAEHLRDQTGRSASDIVAAAERLRDRAFDTSPTFVAVSDVESDRASEESSPDIDGSDAAVSRFLFGTTSPTLPSRPPFHDLARYNPSKHRIEFQRDHPSEKTLELAVVLALVDGLEHRHFSSSRPSGSLDRRLAGYAAEYADDMLVAAGYLYEQRTDSASNPVARIARRPELSRRLEPLSELLTPMQSKDGVEIESDSDLRDRIRQFVLREALTLGAALYRTGGWSGVEVLHEFDLQSTADVVRPDRWMQGRGLGRWTWSKTSLEGRDLASGRVGPALLAIWLGQKFPPKLARTVYSGWRSDAYRLPEGLASRDSGAPSEPHFDWVQQWDTPTSARQIAKALPKILNSEFGARSEGETRWRVVRNGLKVGVAVRPSDRAFDGKSDGTALARSSVQFRPRDSLPLEFVPTRTDSFQNRVERADVEEGTWKDPAAQLRADIEALDDWTFAESKTLPLRWFAKRKDGAVLQLSTELADPFGPDFGSEAYRRSLDNRFSESLDAAEFEQTESLDAPVDSTLHLEIAGEQNGESWKIGVWQFQYGDVVSTLSLQAPEQSYSNYTDVANAVFSSIEMLDPPPGSGDGRADPNSDSIEYEIESQDR